MSGWEYKVVPAPTKGVKGRGVKGPEGRFANALQGLMNEMGATGWEYQRAETLPSTERSGLTGSTTEWRNVLVFRRAVAEPLDDFEPELLPPPEAAQIIAEDKPAKEADTPAAPATKKTSADQETSTEETDTPEPEDADDHDEKVPSEKAV